MATRIYSKRKIANYKPVENASSSSFFFVRHAPGLRRLFFFSSHFSPCPSWESSGLKSGCWWCSPSASSAPRAGPTCTLSLETWWCKWVVIPVFTEISDLNSRLFVLLVCLRMHSYRFLGLLNRKMLQLNIKKSWCNPSQPSQSGKYMPHCYHRVATNKLTFSAFGIIFQLQPMKQHGFWRFNHFEYARRGHLARYMISSCFVLCWEVAWIFVPKITTGLKGSPQK